MKSNNNIKLVIPKYPALIIDTLKREGFDAYIVGGCVRDELLNVMPSDFDITTNAKPETIKKLFKRTIDTGIKHGTVSVLFYENNKPLTFEVTTYRIDGKYDDGRHPNDVVFVDDLKEDLRRRDFTVNAMAYNNESGLVDEFDGLKDLRDKVIRAVGDPYERFSEDALRLLRAVRFAAKLGFRIDEKTEEAIPKLSKNLGLVSKERVQIELTKIITSINPGYVNLVFKYDLAKYICDGFEKVKPGKFEKNLPIHMAYSALLYNTYIDNVNPILRALRLDNNTISKTISLLNALKYYNSLLSLYKKAESCISFEFDLVVKELIDYLKYDLIYDFIRLLEINEGKNEVVIKIRDRVTYFDKNETPIFIGDLDIKGEDLISIGYNGQEVGLALKNLQKIVHKNSKYNQKKLLQDMAKKAYNIYRDNK